MAVNETIVTGRKFRKLTDAASKKWQRISFWHKASDCEFNDGKTAEEKLGAIKGITTDLNVTVPGYAADATRVSELNNSLGGIKFAKDTNGKWGYYEAGADSVTPFSLNNNLSISFLGHSADIGTTWSITLPNHWRTFKCERILGVLTIDNVCKNLPSPSINLTYDISSLDTIAISVIGSRGNGSYARPQGNFELLV